MSKISVQLYTVRTEMKSNDQIRSTLHKLNEMGYNHIEVANVNYSKEEVALIRQICTKLGMTISNSQIDYKKIMKNFDETVENHQLWGCDYITVTILPKKYRFKGEKGIRNFAIAMNKLGERLRLKGLKLLYHHHHMEFVKYGDKTGLEIFMEETNPLYVNLTMDTYWTQRGGKNPQQMMAQFADRIKVIHLRDYSVSISRFKRECLISDAALGEGNLNIKGIIEMAERMEIDYLVVEQESKQAFEDLKTSMTYIQSVKS